jgi:type I restriction-modification system DNA methylase subunit
MSESLLSISELCTKWRKEKSFYEVREVGTGVEIFVKDVLKSPDVFALKVGLNSTKLENRKYEFLEKKTSKGSRQPDITIFITPEIIIPVEVERYGNINAGKDQLLQYQVDLEKKYGILTDGYTWRFYINNVYTQYTLDTVFDKTEIFLEFWREYIKPERYYLSFFERLGQLSLLKEAEQLPVEENRQLFFEDITKLIATFKNKLQIEGYLKDLPKKEKLKTAVEITYAYIIQFILYKTLVDNEFDEFPKQYETLVEAIHSHLKENRFKDILGCIDNISAEISKNIYHPFSAEQRFIADRLLELYRKPRNQLRHVSPWLDIFVFIKKYNFAEVRNEIFGYIYENYLKALYEDEKKGQYYTDPAVVNFMLEQVGYTPENLRQRISPNNNTISLIDPACGSGTFLYSAVDTLIKTIGHDSEQRAKRGEELVNKDIFGLDIAEFPLYLAEMNILMRMLPLIINEKYNNPVERKIKVFKTKDSISEFMDTELRNTIHDIDVAAQKNNGQGFLFKEKLDLGYASYVRDEDDLKEMKESLETRPRCPRRRFDFVVANPPYVGYNESSKQGLLIIKLIQKKKAEMSNIYGVNLNTVPGRIKPYSPKPNLYAFFISLGLALLKDNAKLCYIVPQTLLTANDLDVVRYHLAKYTTIEKIVTFSGKMFIGRGLKQNRPVPTSSLIFVVRRALPNNRNFVEIINCKDTTSEIGECLENIRNNRKTVKRRILQNDLLQQVGNWNFIKHEESFLLLHKQYELNTDPISAYRSRLSVENDFIFDGGVKINSKFLSKEEKTGCFEVFDYTTNRWDRYLVSRSNQYYSTDGPFGFIPGSQGIAAYQRKYKIIWRTRFSNRFQFTDRPILLINNQSLTVASNSKGDLLFYFALLNSSLSMLVLEKSLKQENERDYLVPLRAIKSYIRIPKISSDNLCVVHELIKQAEDLINMDRVVLSDLIDFSGVMMQKFEVVSVKRDNLVLRKDKEERKLEIKTNKGLVEKTIADKYGSDELEFEGKKIALSELKSLPVIDFAKQAVLKDYIDDLVFALYFNIHLTEVGLEYAPSIKELCQKSRFYNLVTVGS